MTFSLQFFKMAISVPSSIGGYDHSFVDAPHDRFICKICHLPSQQPYLTDCCGVIFCKSCLQRAQQATDVSTACAVCRQENFRSMINKQIDREIKSLHIYCTNREKGCEWKGELNDINNHLGNSDGCQFEDVKCSNECGKMIQRRYLTSHVETECPRRMVNCQYCHDTIEHQFIEGQHKEECPKLPLPCPNKCEVGSIPRVDMETHRKECPLEMIQCEYHSVGCKRVKLARKDVEKHDNEKVKEHLMMTKNELTDTKAQLNETRIQLDAALKQIYSIQLDNMARMLKHVCPVTIKMTGFNNKKENSIEEWSSNPFYTHDKGYKMCLRIFAGGEGNSRGTHLSLFLLLMKGPHDDELTWPLRGAFEIKLLNQISDSEHYSVSMPFDDTPAVDRVVVGERSREGWGWEDYISFKDLNECTSAYQLLKDDCLFFQVIKL